MLRRFHTIENRVYLLMLAAAIGSMLSACQKEPFDQVLEKGELIVLTRNAPSTYVVGRGGAEGYEFDLASAFAEHLGVKAKFVLVDSVDAVLNGISSNSAHLAAAGLTRTRLRESDPNYLFGPDYREVTQQLVCHQDGPNPESFEGLPGTTIQIIGNSSYEERLRDLQLDYPELSWTTSQSSSTEQILRRVWNREVDCTVADSNIVAINRRYFPELVVAMDITEPQYLAWMMSADASRLQAASHRWMNQPATRDLIERLEERYYSHVELFDFVDVKTFQSRVSERLPAYRQLFKQAAKDTGLPWTLLAAQAYQESHWDESARSPTGVRGLMMLTQNTALELGVNDRLDPAQSISGGARYLADLLERVPDSVEGEDRLWFALAAYNIGFGHLLDARELARRQNLNPDVWQEIKTTLPLLADENFHVDLRYGYARGTEPVRYLDRIRHYQDLLERYLSDKNRLPNEATVVDASVPGAG